MKMPNVFPPESRPLLRTRWSPLGESAGTAHIRRTARDELCRTRKRAALAHQIAARCCRASVVRAGQRLMGPREPSIRLLLQETDARTESRAWKQSSRIANLGTRMARALRAKIGRAHV